MKVIVLGASGFIGRSLFQYFLSHSYVTEGWIRRNKEKTCEKEFKYFDIDSIIDLESLLKADVIINAVGAGVQSKQNVSLENIYLANLTFPIRLIDFLAHRNYNGRLITIGSYFEIGDEINYTKYTEEQVIKAFNKVPNHYCASKRMFTNFVYSYKTKLQHVHLILPTVYGPAEDSNRLIPYLLNKLLKQKRPSLSSGQQVRQYLFVGDLCESVAAIVRCFYELRQPFLNIPSAETLTVLQLAKMVYDYLNLPLEQSIMGSSSMRDESMKYLILDTTTYEQLGLPPPRYSLKQIIPTYNQ